MVIVTIGNFHHFIRLHENHKKIGMEFREVYKILDAMVPENGDILNFTF